MNAGFQTCDVMEADLDFRQLKIPASQRPSYKLSLIDRLRALPGVEGVADASVVPLSGFGWQENIFLAGAPKTRRRGPSFHPSEPRFFQHQWNPHHGRSRIRRARLVQLVEGGYRQPEFCEENPPNGASPIGAHFQIEEAAGRARSGPMRSWEWFATRSITTCAMNSRRKST